MLALVAIGCGAPSADRHRAILIGIDGASPRLMTPLLDAALLPNLARLRAEGVYGTLRSELPLYSPRVWNSIATGKPPDEHGIAAFVFRDGDTKRLYRSGHRRVPAIWNIVSQLGRSVSVVNWWTTFPPEKVGGAMVSDHFFHEQLEMLQRTFGAETEDPGALVYPEDVEPIVRAAAERAPVLPVAENPFRASTPLPPWVNRESLSKQLRIDSRVTRVAEALEQHAPADVTFVFLPGIDRVSHALWGNIEPPDLYPPQLRPTDEDRAGGVRALQEYYTYTDALIGRLIAPFGPDDLVMIVSDHGFEAGQALMLLTGEHETDAAIDGVLFVRGAGIAKGGKAQMTLYDVAPTLLSWLGIPPGRDMAGQPADFVSKAGPAPAASYDGIPIERVRVGSAGREGEIVEQLEALGYLENGQGVGNAAPPERAQP
jgi:predicted AlkP superfamily phosphohydrolase/phosphomutase